MSADEITMTVSDIAARMSHEEALDALEADIEGDPLFDLPEVISKDAKDSPEVIEPYENDDPEVYGIAFPKTMLPLGAMSGVWTADEIWDLNNEDDEVFVRVWLYGPTGPGQP